MSSIGTAKVIDQQVNGSKWLIYHLRSENDELVKDKECIDSPLYQNHFMRVQEAVCKAFDGMEKGALIVGVGAGQDIPLEKLGRAFETVRLIDIDLRYTRKAVEQLPEELREKFELEEADLSGIMAELSREAEKIAALNPKYDVFVKKILDLLPTLKRQRYAYQKQEYSFVCSALVGSQVGCNLISYLDALSSRIYGIPFRAGDRIEELNDFVAKLLLTHVEELNQLASKEGRIYFADHFSVERLFLNDTDEKGAPEVVCKIILPGAHRTKRLVKRLFSLIKKEEWEWGLPIPSKSARDLRLYRISSHIFRKN